MVLVVDVGWFVGVVGPGRASGAGAPLPSSPVASEVEGAAACRAGWSSPVATARSELPRGQATRATSTTSTATAAPAPISTRRVVEPDAVRAVEP